MRGSLGLLAAVIVVGLVFVAHALVIRTERSGDANRLLDLGAHANWVKPFS
jgi:hypothetical protein